MKIIDKYFKVEPSEGLNIVQDKNGNYNLLSQCMTQPGYYSAMIAENEKEVEDCIKRNVPIYTFCNEDHLKEPIVDFVTGQSDNGYHVMIIKSKKVVFNTDYFSLLKNDFFYIKIYLLENWMCYKIELYKNLKP